jgi:hypothetical protein
VVQPNYRARKAVNGVGVENHLDFEGLNKSQWFTYRGKNICWPPAMHRAGNALCN